MKILLYTTALVLIGSCASLSHKEKIQAIKDNIEIHEPSLLKKYANTITDNELKEHLYIFSADSLLGRRVGNPGQKKGVKYIKDFYTKEGIVSPYGNGNYYQNIPKSFFKNEHNDSENVLSFIEGSEKPDEIIIISAHHDHEGVDTDGNVYNGADDNGSGSMALLEMAQAFKKAKADGFGPKRSILFLHLTAEEIGLQGSLYYTEHPAFPLKNTVVNLNIDMIGRIDKHHQENTNYIYIIGANRISAELHYVSEAINNRFFNLEFDYKYNAKNEYNSYYYRSDHYNFAKNNIPVIFYFNGEHDDYHKTTDTPDKIDYQLLEKRTRLIFATAWQLANQKERLVLDNL